MIKVWDYLKEYKLLREEILSAVDDVFKNGTLIFGPKLDEFEEKLGIKLKIDKNQEIDTLGGFIFFYLGRIPGRGEVINYDKLLEFTILEADTRKIKRILVSLK